MPDPRCPLCDSPLGEQCPHSCTACLGYGYGFGSPLQFSLATPMGWCPRCYGTQLEPYYSDGERSIFLGDCRTILPLIQAKVDLVLTSPPYNIGLNYPTYQDELPPEEHRELVRQWLRDTRRLVSDSARMYAVVSDAMLWWLRAEAEAADWHWGQLLAWCKPNFAGGTKRMAGDWNNMTEWVMLFRSGKRTPMQNGLSNTHNFFVIPSPQSTWQKDRKQHPAQWPVELPLRLISRTPGELVLDPFMGSGSALVAAKRLGRRAIGIDVDEEACAIAAERLAQAVLPLAPRPAPAGHARMEGV